VASAQPGQRSKCSQFNSNGRAAASAVSASVSAEAPAVAAT
jgi:hypothetical protein